MFSLGANTAARYYLPKDRPEVRLGDYQSLTTAMTVIFIPIAALVTFAFLRAEPRYGGWLSIALSAGLGAVTLLSYMEADALNAFGRLRLSSLVSAIGSAVTTILVIVLASTHELTLTTTLEALVLGSFMQTVICVLVLRLDHRTQRLMLRRGAWSKMLRMGIPALGMNAGQSLTFRLDRYIVAGVLGPAPLGVYSIAVTGSEILRIIPAAWGQLAFFSRASGGQSLVTSAANG